MLASVGLQPTSHIMNVFHIRINRQAQADQIYSLYTSDAQPGYLLGKPHIDGPDETNKTNSTMSCSVSYGLSFRFCMNLLNCGPTVIFLCEVNIKK